MDKLKKRIKLSPLQILVLGYLFITIIGAILLSLPISSSKGSHQPFLDALFISTSGISTSGLTVVDIGSYYSLFGQIVLMCIFQIGGIGYMTFVVFIAYILRTQLSLNARIVAKESIATHKPHKLGSFFKKVLLYTFIFEFIGAFILAIFWSNKYSISHSIYLGIFHSVSAFCTAGFSIFPSSLMNYKTSMVVNLTIDIISILGGIGFFVLIDLYNFIYKKYKNINPRRLTVHSRMALLVTFFVILMGGIIILISEKWSVSTSSYDRILISFFQTISASTTDGFNSIDIGAMSAASLTVLMILMFIGASPGSTGGGIKTTTFGTLFVSGKSYLQGKKTVNIYGRELPLKTIIKASTLFCLFIIVVLVDVIILANTEKSSYIQTLFEIVSALGNTGLSTGITPNLTIIGKVVLTITMFIGRVGPLTIGTAFITKPKFVLLKYPKEDIFIG